VLKCLREVIQSCPRRGDFARLGEKRRVDGGAIGNQNNNEFETIVSQLRRIPGEVSRPMVRGSARIAWGLEFRRQKDDRLAVAELFLDHESCERIGQKGIALNFLFELGRKSL